MADVIQRGSHLRPAYVVAGIVALVALYVLGAQAGVAFAGVGGSVSLVWPPAGIGLAALLLLGLRFWPGVAAGAFLSGLLTGAPPLAAVFNAVGITLAVAGATLALRLTPFRPALDRVSDVVAYVGIGALLASVVSAAIGTTGLMLAGRVPTAAWVDVAWKWWMGDATGVLVVGAAILTLDAASRRPLRLRRLVEGVAVVLAIFLLGVLVLAAGANAVWSTYPIAYLFFPLLILGAFRFGPVGAAVASLLIASLTVYATAQGLGPFAPAGDESGLALLSLFIGVVSVTGLFVAAVIAERAGASSERERLASIIQATSDFVGIMDLEGHVLFVNRAGRAMLGIGADEDLTGRTVADFHTPEMTERVRGVGLRAALESGLWTGESTLLHRDGSEIPVSQVIVTHRDADGDVQFVSTVARDLTERMRLEQQLMHAQKMEAVGRLAGGIAHDFNNLLTVILGQARLAEDALAETHPARAGVEDIAEAAGRAASLTRQLLAFARRQRVEPRIIDLNVLVRRMDRMLRRVIGEDVRLETRCASGLWPVRVDPGQFEQLLVNLAVNARDAMPVGGTLTIETRNVVSTTGPDAGPGVAIAVSDTGTGMDAETLSHMFEPFYTTKGRDRGTGLGLATCYGIVTQAGGTIGAESRPGEGATFTVVLPAANGPIESVHDDTDDADPAGRGTILLVEDEAGVRHLAQRILEQHGYEVLTATDGVDALERIAQIGDVLDLIITDMVMPRMSGPQLVERLRADGNDVKVLFISGYAGDTNPSEVTPFLPKPFTPAQLARRVHALLEE